MSDRITIDFEGIPATPARPRFPVAHRLALMVDAWRTRRLLAELDPRQLKDIGISRGEALVEIARPPWDIGERP